MLKDLDDDIEDEDDYDTESENDVYVFLQENNQHCRQTNI